MKSATNQLSLGNFWFSFLRSSTTLFLLSTDQDSIRTRDIDRLIFSRHNCLGLEPVLDDNPDTIRMQARTAREAIPRQLCLTLSPV